MPIFDITIFWVTIAPTYYWLMYALAFIFGYIIIKKRWVIYNNSKKNELLDDLFFYVFLWVILWWRLGYVFFYNFYSFFNNPLEIFKVWEWWMSFHGWVIGVIIAMILFSKKNKINFLKVADQVTLVLPIWLGLWRIWNYINWELLWYKWYEGFLAVYIDWVWYFPSTLLEAFFEWFILFFILNFIFYINKNKSCNINWKKANYLYDGQIASLFLIFYSIFRIFAEIFFRTPDEHIGYVFNYFTLWEILSIPMFIFGLIFYFRFKK